MAKVSSDSKMTVTLLAMNESTATRELDVQRDLPKKETQRSAPLHAYWHFIAS